LANEQRVNEKKDPIITIPLVHRYSNESVVKKKIIKDLKCYYHLYSNDEFKLCSTVYSDLTEKNFNVISKIKSVKANIETKIMSDEKIIEPVIANLVKLKAKNKKVEEIIKLKVNCIGTKKK
jgi:hypothetical protein